MAFNHGPLRALVLDVNFDVHGVPATVTPSTSGAASVATRILWITPIAEAVPNGMEFQRQEPRRVMAIRRDVVPLQPRLTKVTAPEIAGGPDMGWLLDGLERREADHDRHYVIADPDYLA